MLRDLEFPPKVVVETFVETFFFGVKCFELLGMVCLSKLFWVFFLFKIVSLSSKTNLRSCFTDFLHNVS